jgi:hypothetical protein
MMCRSITLLLALLIGASIEANVANADGGFAASPSQSNLIKQSNAPISNLFQIRFQDGYAPAFQANCTDRAMSSRSL